MQRGVLKKKGMGVTDVGLGLKMSKPLPGGKDKNERYAAKEKRLRGPRAGSVRTKNLATGS